MEYLSIILIFFILFLCFGLLSKRLGGSLITPPMIFVGAGLLLSDSFQGVADALTAFHPWHWAFALISLTLFRRRFPTSPPSTATWRISPASSTPAWLRCGIDNPVDRLTLNEHDKKPSR